MITEKMIADSPEGTVWIFGDNMEQVGLGGQARIARQFVASGKAFGIPTKRSQTLYFHDHSDEMLAVVKAFKEITRMINEGKTIIFFPRIGHGLARMDEMSPSIMKYIDDTISAIVNSGCATIAKF